MKKIIYQIKIAGREPFNLCFEHALPYMKYANEKGFGWKMEANHHMHQCTECEPGDFTKCPSCTCIFHVDDNIVREKAVNTHMDFLPENREKEK